MNNPTPSVELTILMPCLNEAETLARCITKAQQSIQKLNLSAEVLIADNGSSDGSPQLAETLGARVVHVEAKGYGNALRAGIEAAHGKWILLGDADDSYDFSDIIPFVERLRAGDDFVMGCRLPAGGGRIMAGAMPWKHRWIGNPILSAIGRLFFRSPIHDFHCGLRALTKEAYRRMALQTTGMEFASEMVIKATLQQLKISEVPITLYKDGRNRPPHLRSWRDGWRHLRFMLLYSPRWLFLIPGLLLSVAGLIGMSLLANSNLHLGKLVFDVGTFSVACMSLLVGSQLIAFACFTKVFAIAEGLLPEDPLFQRLFRFFTLEKGIACAGLLLTVGLGLLSRALLIWKQMDFGELSYSDNPRRILLAVTLIILGVQGIFSSLFLSVLGLKTSRRTPPTTGMGE